MLLSGCGHTPPPALSQTNPFDARVFANDVTINQLPSAGRGYNIQLVRADAPEADMGCVYASPDTCTSMTYTGEPVLIDFVLLNDPDLLILDEPTAGLDPLERIRFRNLISRLGESRTVLLATHIVSDVEYIAKEILLLKQGRLLRQDTVEQPVSPLQQSVWEMTVGTEDEVSLCARQYLVSNVRQLPEHFVMRVVADTPPSTQAVSVRPTLEDVYLHEFGEASLPNAPNITIKSQPATESTSVAG